MKIKNLILAFCPLLILLAGCTKDTNDDSTKDGPKDNTEDVVTDDPAPEDPTVIDRTAFTKGADVSWLTQMEAEGRTFYNSLGKKTECMTLLKQQCNVNAIRLRVWVDPTDRWCNIDDVMVKARRANALGLRLMIDFHFSDTWADPGKQIVPRAWKDLSFDKLKTAMADHVTAMMTKLKAENITPEWVQIGNETSNGMMYDSVEAYDDLDHASNYTFTDGASGILSNGSNFAELVNTGYDAAKAVFPSTKVIVHIDSGNNWYRYLYIFGYLQSKGGKYDMIGISLYPENSSWETYIDNAVTNIQKAYTTYNKETMVVEIGMDYDHPTECRDAIKKLMTEGAKTTHLKGVFYWEPQASRGYNGGYSKGCFNNNRPTVALDAFAMKM